MNSNKTIILVGGGTGGHAMPILELYQILKKNKNINPIVVGSGSPVEKNIFSKERIDRLVLLRTGKIRRHFTIHNLYELVLLFFGFVKSLYIFLRFKPQFVFSKGGFVAVPILFWASFFKIPFFIHESDVEFGYANKMFAKKAKRVFVGLPIIHFHTKFNDKLEFAGQFLSSNYCSQGKIKLFKNSFPTILFTGGSQGAVGINNVVIKALPKLLRKYNIIHQTGSLDYDRIKKAKDDLNDSLKEQYLIKDFFSVGEGKTSMKNAFLNSDIFVGRASTTTPAEATFFKKPLILIPYSHASGNHQYKNAKIIEEAGAGIMIQEKDLTEEKIISTIDNLLNNKTEQEKMVSSAEKIFGNSALNIITEAINNELECEEP